MEDWSQPRLISRIGTFLEFVHHTQEWKAGISIRLSSRRPLFMSSVKQQVNSELF